MLTAHASDWNFAQAPVPTGGGGGNTGGGGGGGDTGGGGGDTGGGGGDTGGGGGGTTLPEAKCTVPNIKGKTVAQATTALKAANCALGKISKKKVKKGKSGVVLSQSPAAGQSLPVGSKVNVSVSQKKKKKK